MRKRLKILYLFIMFGAIIFSYSNVAYASDCQDVSDCYGSIEAGIDVAAAMTYLLAGMMLYAEIVTFFLAPEIAIPIIIAKGTYEFGSGKDLYKSWADNANFKDTHRHAYTEEQLKLSWMERVIGVLPLATVIGLEAREMSEAWQLSKEINLISRTDKTIKETNQLEDVIKLTSEHNKPSLIFNNINDTSIEKSLTNHIDPRHINQLPQWDPRNPLVENPKSYFYSGIPKEQIKSFIREAGKYTPTLQPATGKFQIILKTDRAIGEWWDGKLYKGATNYITIILDDLNNLISAFPGLPKGM